MMQKNYLSMINSSEAFTENNHSLSSLCERCATENPNSTTQCLHIESTPFLRNKIFYRGNIICNQGQSNVDCIYKYHQDKVIGIEIKNQPIKNSLDDDLIKKIISLSNSVNSKKLALQLFILQISSQLNSNKNHYQLLHVCEEFFNAYGFKLRLQDGLNYLFCSKHNMRIKFDVMKCKDFDEEKFCSLL